MLPYEAHTQETCAVLTCPCVAVRTFLSQAADIAIDDGAWGSLPVSVKRKVVARVSNGTGLVIITSPAMSNSQLADMLQQFSPSIAVSKDVQLPAGTTSTVVSTAFHGLQLPQLLTTYSDRTQGFSAASIKGGTVVAFTSDRIPTAVQFAVPGGATITVLGYWQPPVVVYVAPTTASLADETLRQAALSRLNAAGITTSAQPVTQPPEINANGRFVAD